MPSISYCSVGICTQTFESEESLRAHKVEQHNYTIKIVNGQEYAVRIPYKRKRGTLERLLIRAIGGV